jgi:YhgE/Pip-like protein
MKSALIALLRQPSTIIGVVAALMFQLIFSIVWMTGYNGITDNAKNLKIAIVNEDAGLGARIADGLVSNLPFVVEKMDSLSAAQTKLNERDVQMVLHLAPDFTKQLQTPSQTAQIHYYINESNPQLIKSIMQSVAGNVTMLANKQAVAAGAQAMLTQVNPNLPAAQAGQVAQGLAERVSSDFQTSNKVSGMQNQMVPMMLVLACFVGSMIKAQNLQISINTVARQHGKWNAFGARVILNVIAAAIIGLVSTTMVHLLGGQSVVSFAAMWGFIALVLLTFMFFAQMFLILLGNAGMLLNIIMLSTQLVSSGAMVPRELLSSFYNRVSEYLPATYAVEGNMDLLFGGPSLGSSAMKLVWILVVCLAVGGAGVAIRREKRAPAQAPAAAPAAS